MQVSSRLWVYPKVRWSKWILSGSFPSVFVLGNHLCYHRMFAVLVYRTFAAIRHSLPHCTLAASVDPATTHNNTWSVTLSQHKNMYEFDFFSLRVDIKKKTVFLTFKKRNTQAWDTRDSVPLSRLQRRHDFMFPVPKRY